MANLTALGPKGVAALAAVVVLGGTLGGYAIHERRAAEALAAKNQRTTAALNDTQHELVDLTTKVNMLVARNEAQTAVSRSANAARAAKIRVRREDPRYKRLQSQLDAQGKAIAETQSQLANTQGDLNNTRTELTGSIAHTHDELVVLEKKGERNYSEFDLMKSKQFEHKGPVGIRLKKANVKHQYADLELIVDDRTLSQKHVNLYQPVMFSTPDSPQPVEIVINNVSKNHIHGYISAPKYRQSELASMTNAPAGAAQNPNQGQADAGGDPSLKKRPSLPQ